MADADEELSVNEEEGGVEPEAEEEEVEEESILTEYDADDFFSGAVNTLDSTIPLNIFEFEYSYSYNCHKYFNICACDDTVVCWAAGSIITFMDVNTKQTWFRRSTTGGSVGNITSFRQDPNYRIAIAEGREGDKDPLIMLYTWPQMELDAVLRDGTTNSYSKLDFSVDGEMLASVGMEPDYNLTIWNWKRHRILLRTSAFTFDVNTVMFSPYCPGQLTTAGAAHIKFWKMAQTFTGLKLKGELGRFGKTEICDVLGVYPMPDEKVLSGCEWGNVLVWEAGLVKVEVTQRGRKTCHKAPVIQFMLSPAGDEVTTIARDGCIRAWYWDTVEQADPPEEDPYVELNPVAETCVPGCQIMSLRHQKDFYWYAQDGNGGLWCADIEIDKLECSHRKVFTCHAGAVVAIAMLRTHPILVTAGEDGALQAYSSESHLLLARYMFPNPVSCMLYPPVDVDSTSRIVMVGFRDGIMRTLLLHPERLQKQASMVDIRVHSALTIHSDDSDHPDVIDMISLLKPHSKAIVQISINEHRTLLVTAGRDSTIFMYKLTQGTPFTLDRLGFIETPNNVEYMTWKPDEEYQLLLCGQVGFIMEALLPKAHVRKYSNITTFKLEFQSYKEVLVKKHYMRHRPFPTEEDLASIDEEALKKAAEAGDDKDEDEEYVGEIQLIESESMLGTAISWAQYCDEGIWVVQKGTGTLLLVKPGSNKIYKYAPFPGAWCDDITALRFVCEGRYLVIGTNTGYIRMVRMPEEEDDSPDYHYVTWMDAMTKLLKKLKGRRLAKEELQPIPRIDFSDNYYLPMHDRYTGAINCLEFSSDGKRLFTCGADGNIFSYLINFEEPLLPLLELPEHPELKKTEKFKEPSTVDGEIMSHEQLKQKEEYDKMMAIANAHKKRVRDQLSELTFEYNKLIKANKLLPVSQQIDVTLDPRPLVVQENELDVAKALTIRKLAHQLEASDLALYKMHSRNIIQLDVFPFILKAIRDPGIIIRPLRQKNLSKAFRDQLEEVHQKMAEAALRGRRAESTTRRAAARRASWGQPRVASFLLGLPPHHPHPLKKALRNYYQRLHRHHGQFIEWQEHLSRKPDPNAMPPGAAEAMKEAEASIGNKVLKTHPDYVAPPGHNTQLRVCNLRQEIYDNKREFNEKVLKLREHKLELVSKMKRIGERLAEIRIEIPAKLVRPAPPIPVIDEELEFPEKNLEIKPEVKYASTSRHRRSTIVQDRKSTAVYPQPRVRQPRVSRFLPLIETRPLAVSWELLKPRPDNEATPIENEVRERRIERHLYEQDMLVAEAEMSIQQFDSRLLQLQRERIRVQERNQLLELNLYQLHREMNVLNRFEAHEDRLAERVYAKLMQVRGVQDQITDCEHRIEEHFAEKANLEVMCEDLQRQFKKMAQDNKFADFLRRIFKKKYRPPRDRDEDGARLIWPETYHYKGVMTVPSANLTEPYEFWCDTTTGNYRVAINNGTTNIIQKLIGNIPTFYMVGPETTDSYQNKMLCRELGKHSYAARALHNAQLPLSGYLKQIDREDLEGKKTIRWRYSSNISEYNASFEHIVWTNTERFDANNEKNWKPIRYVHRLLHESTTLEFVQFDYHQFDTNTLDPAVFDLGNGMKCRYYGNDIRELNVEQLNPVLEHYRIREMFERFKVNHKKVYKNKDEHFMRLGVFKDNLRYIDSINRQQTSYTLAVNQFSDMTEDELPLFTSSEIGSEVLFNSRGEFVDDVEDEQSQQRHTFDWRDIHDAVTSVKESSESEESSSSSEEDDASLDSRDIGPIRLDPNICPEGCDPEVYEKTYELRNTRHKHEQEMIEQNHLVELLRKDIDAHNKVKRKLSVQLDQRKNQLREFMLEKQNCMNEVDQVIVLRYDQIRAAAIRGCTGSEGLSKTIVFPEKTLMKLRNRVLELQDEINQQKKRQKVNRTHLFRMNIDLRAMADQAEEMRAQMRDVLTRKLGKPRRVDKTLDDLLRLMARRHKFGATLGAIPQMLQQLREWRDRYSELEQKYMQILNQNSNRLRLAAALQADVLPHKTYMASDIVGPYDTEVYYRDVVRLRIVRSQQVKQMKILRDEILNLKLKPMSPRQPLPSSSPPVEVREEIYLFMPPRVPWRPAQKYFPTTPLGSTIQVHDVNIMKLLNDCLDSMRVTRDDAELLLRDLTDQLPLVLTGAKSRYDVVDEMVKRWVVKYGGDPALYKKQTRAFDSLAALAERLLREHMEMMEGAGGDEVAENLESALKDIAGEKEPLHKRLGPALAALCLTTEPADLETIETMVSLVKSLVDQAHVLTQESLDKIEIFDVVEDIKDCGFSAPDNDIEAIVTMAIECLKAQLTTDEENRHLRDEVEKEFEYGRKSLRATFTMPPSSLAGTTASSHSMKSRRSVGSVQTTSSRHSKASGSVHASVSSRTAESDPSASTRDPKEQGGAEDP